MTTGLYLVPNLKPLPEQDDIAGAIEWFDDLKEVIKAGDTDTAVDAIDIAIRRLKQQQKPPAV